MKRWIALLLSAACHGLPAGARQVSEYVIQNWETDAGLPQSTVNAITQTADGYLWVGTDCGLARFDGLRFTVFLPGKIPELGNGRITGLCGAADGSLLIGTDEGALLRYSQGTFSENLVTPDSMTEGEALINVVEHQNGRVYFSLSGGRVGYVGDGVSRLCGDEEGWPSGATQVRDGPGPDVWVTSGSRVYLLEDRAPRLLIAEGEVRVRQFLCPARDGGYWIHADDKVRLYRGGKWVGGDHPVAPRMGNLTHALEDREGFLWLATSRDGLFRYDTTGRILHLSRESGLPDDTVMKIFEDREGNIWAGTLGHGLVRMRVALFSTYGIQQGMASAHVTGACPDAQGRVWITTADNGLHLLENGNVREIVSGNRMGLMGVDVGPDGSAWAMDRLDGVFTSDGTRLAATGWLASSQHEATGLFKDTDGTLWACGKDFRCLTGVLGGERRTIAFPEEWGPVTVCCMVRSNDKSLWVGTARHGLLRFSEGKWDRIHTAAADSAPAPVWCLLEDAGSALWLGTKGAGIMCWKDNRLSVCDERHGLPDSVICGIAEDSLGHLWCSSHRGIFRLKKPDLERCLVLGCTLSECVRFGRSDGLPSLECTGGYHPGVRCGPDGLLYFPTWNGLVVVDPTKVPVNNVPPQVYLERVLVNGLPMREAGGDMLLPHTSRNIEFQFTGVSFMAPEEVRFRTRLTCDGSGSWQDIGGENRSVHKNLDPGRYRFEVIAANRDGIWNERPASFDFAIRAAFWQTPWFWAVIAAGVGAGLVGLGRMAARRRDRKRIAELEMSHMIESERLRIARDLHDGLGARASQLGLLAGLAETQHPRSKAIRETAHSLILSLDEAVWLVNPTNDTVRHLGDYVTDYAEEILRPAEIDCRFACDPAPLPPIPLPADTRHNLFQAVKEALANVLKHARATSVDIRMEYSRGWFSARISDNGCGYSTAAKGRHGLDNMHHRLSQMGGRMDIESNPGSGTIVTFRVRIPRTWGEKDDMNMRGPFASST